MPGRALMEEHVIDRNDYEHPEKIYKDLVHAPTLSKEARLERKYLKSCFNAIHDGIAEEKAKELCWSCGWKVENEWYSSYGSRIRILYTHHNIGIWAIGDNWLIRDRPNDASIGNDFMTQEFLRNQPGLTIPLVKEMRKLNAPTDKIDLTMMSRIDGVGLDTIWHTLTEEQASSYKDQLGDAIKQWRRFTSPVAKKVDGSFLDDCIIGNCEQRTAPTCKKIRRTNDEWFDILEKDLRMGLCLQYDTKDPSIIEDKFQELKRNFPKSGPYVLTHGDLNLSNILVKDDKIQAIIDWEYSGYFPWWYERWISLIGGNDQSDQLFDPLWADYGPEMDEDTFQTEVFNKVAPVVHAWKKISKYVEHDAEFEKWLRPGFCECKPYTGSFKREQVGDGVKHDLKNAKIPEGYKFWHEDNEKKT